MHSAAQAWVWVPDNMAIEANGCLTFAQNLTPRLVLQRLGIDATDAVLARLDEARVRFQNQRDDRGRPIPWLLVGLAGEWAFTMEDDSALGEQEAAALSRGAAAASVTWTVMGDYQVRYFEDGTCLVALDPLVGEASLTGSEPGRFRSQIDELVASERDLVVAMLAFLTQIAGIEVPEKVATGPLLTVQGIQP